MTGRELLLFVTASNEELSDPCHCFASLAMTGDGGFFMACGSQTPAL